MSYIFPDATPERKTKVCEDLRQGSDPRLSFFLLVGLSTLIAAFGLVMNSIAVVIGAMLVAPLMTPILGLGLGLIRSDASLIGVSLKSEAIGVAVSIMAGVLLGLTLPSHFEPTSEMLGRTHPNLFDLFVAVLAGFAGAYALVDEKLSPVLPGVAISTAIVPPLANSGMCLALGFYQGAIGSFLLFFTNFLSIMLVSAAVFHAAGMKRKHSTLSKRELLRRFGPATVALTIVTALLSFQLLKLFEEGRLNKQITRSLQGQFANLRIQKLDNLVIEQGEDGILIQVDVQATDVIGPSKVAAMESRLSEITNQPTSLYVKTAITHRVSAQGSINRPIVHTLDGFEIRERSAPGVDLLQPAEQVIREYLEEKLIRLTHLKLFPFKEQYILLAELEGTRPLSLNEIRELERRINDQPDIHTALHLLIQFSRSDLRDKSGRLRIEFDLPRIETREELVLKEGIVHAAREWLKSRGYWLHSTSFTILDGTYNFLLEIYGQNLLGSAQRQELKERLLVDFDVPLELYVRSEIEAVMGPDGNVPLPELLDTFREQNEIEYQDQLLPVIKSAR
jgi:uncharacterized hydrophobic protein (TIGR00271 family)